MEACRRPHLLTADSRSSAHQHKTPSPDFVSRGGDDGLCQRCTLRKSSWYNRCRVSSPGSLWSSVPPILSDYPVPGNTARSMNRLCTMVHRPKEPVLVEIVDAAANRHRLFTTVPGTRWYGWGEGGAPPPVHALMHSPLLVYHALDSREELSHCHWHIPHSRHRLHTAVRQEALVHSTTLCYILLATFQRSRDRT